MTRFLILISALITSAYAQVNTSGINSRSAKIKPSDIRVIDKVVIIKAISSSKKTFLIKNGFADGIAENQTALFSNKHVTIEARAIEVAYNSSLWEVRDERSVAPFDKNDIIVFTNNLERRPFEVPELHRLEEKIAKVNYEKGETKDTFAMRGSLSRAMSESTTEAATAADPLRQGYQFELMYIRNFATRWEYSLGVRFDQEIATLEAPALDVPTTRLMGTFDLLYHFNNDLSRAHYYAGLGLGYGRSITEVNGLESSGSAIILPVARLGRTFDWHRTLTFFAEGALESIAMSEKLDDSSEQTTTIVNAKFTIGLRF